MNVCYVPNKYDKEVALQCYAYSFICYCIVSALFVSINSGGCV